MASGRRGNPKKGERNDGEFETFLDDLSPSLEQGGEMERFGVSGKPATRGTGVDMSRIIAVWPQVSDRIIEEMR